MTLRARTVPKKFAVLAAAVVLAGMVPLSVAPPAAADEKPLGDNSQRLRFYGTELNGALFDGRTLLGKPAVIWFWSPPSFCGICLAEAPVISRVAAANPQVSFLGIAGRGAAGSMQSVVADNNLRFPNLTDANGQLWQSFFVPWPPAWAFIRPDGDGYLINDITSPMTEDALTARVAALTAP